MMYLVLKKLGMDNYECLYRGGNKEFAQNFHFALSRANKYEKYLYLYVPNLENVPVQ